MQPILPWHEKSWYNLTSLKVTNKLPHAILIKGISGVGKFAFAKNLAQVLLCQSNSQQACDQCNACVLFQAENHPDFVIIQPEEAGKAIKIDQVREVISDLNNTSHQGGMKVVIINSAELLNIAAANALLKTLEEPISNTIIILVTAHPLLLPATIRSRCQTVAINAPTKAIAENWLKQQLPGEDVALLLAIAENAPLKALNLSKEGILVKRQEFFEAFDKLLQGKIKIKQMVEISLEWQLDSFLTLLSYLVSDLIKLKLCSNRNLINLDQLKALGSLARKAQMEHLLKYQDFLLELRKQLFARITLNQQLVVENLIITLCQL